MRLSRPKNDRSDFEVVVTSMLDINFLLIMFFLMTAHFQLESHAQLELPREQGELDVQVDEAGMVINIRADGGIVVLGDEVSMNDLRARVQKQIELLKGESESESLKMMVRADRNAGTGQLNRVVTLLREMGVGTIRIGTELPL